MDFLDGILIGLAGLRKHPLRAFLTILGIIIGIGAVVSVVAIGDGARVLTLTEIQQTGGTNIVEIYRNQWSRSSRGGTLAQTARQAIRTGRWQYNRAENLEYPDVLALENGAENVVQAVAEVEVGDINATFEGNSKYARLVGASIGYDRSHNWYITTGRFLSDIDIEQGALVGVIGSQLAKDMYGESDPVGQMIRAQRFHQHWGDSFDIRLKVIGVLQAKGDSGSTEGWDDSIIIPLTTFQERITGRKDVARIRAEVADVNQLNQAATEIEAVLSKQHPGPDNQYELWMATEELATAEHVGLIMKLMLGGIASIALLVAGIGIMNIMLISVTERTKEIGLRKAIGARSRDILFQFLVESATLSLSGGIFGIVFGVFLGRSSAKLISKFVWEDTQWPVVFSATSAIIAFAVAMFVGIFFGLYPARKAARLSPIEALRREG
ncbi:MAG: FtsX-like permease family protein [Candidatus Poribacteria bacterium]|nr:FtsX-like permease family protein [Candidatus Poribacteria bacterium]